MSTLDPRARLLIFPLLFIPPLSTQSPAALAAMLLLAALAVGRTRRGLLTRALGWLLLGLNLASLALWPLFVHQEPVLWGPYTTLGLTFGLSMGLRLSIFSLLGLLFAATSSVEQITWALRQLGLPYGAAFTVTAAFRLLDRTVRTARSVQAAQRSRGLDLHAGGVLQRVRSHLPLLVPILVLSLRRVDGMAMAMEARGFGLRGRRTSLVQASWGLRDSAALLVALAVAVSAVLVRLQGLGVLVAGRL